MKKLKTFLVAATVLLATSAFASAGPEKVSPKVKAEFEKSFTGAVNVNWQKNEDYHFASFILNSNELSAAYNENGELMGVSREIATTQLPITVALAISDKYQGYDVAKTVTELNYEGQTSYFVVVENSKQVLKLKCNSSGAIMVNSKTKK